MRGERLAWPDLLKGLGIFLVTLGHSALVDKTVTAWIYTFHMPLFFFLSGYFFTRQSGPVWNTIRHKAFPILAPMVSYSLCRWGWSAASALLEGGAPDVRPLLGIFLQWGGTDFDGYVWFFAGLFSAECLFALLLQYMEDRPLRLLGACFLIALAVWCGARMGMPRLPWHLDGGSLLLPYLCLGWVIRRYQAEIDRILASRTKEGTVILGLLAIQLVSMLVNLRLGPTRIDYNLRLLNEYATAYLAGVSGVGWFWLLGRKLPAPRCLTFVGEYSAVYYCVGWIGSNIAHRLVWLMMPVRGLSLLGIHLLGMWILPVPLILGTMRFCPELIGKKRRADLKSESVPR